MLATIMQVLDTTIANVALPTCRGASARRQDTITWVLTSYIVAAAIMTPVTGWLPDRFGRKRAVPRLDRRLHRAPRCCAASPASLEEMVLFRLLQGVFGAALVPLSQAVLLDINPQERHGQAMAIWGAGIMVGPIIGPTLGGWLTETLRLALGVLHQPAGRHPRLPRRCRLSCRDATRRLRGFDFFGFAMLSLAIGALQLMLDRGEQLDWFSSPEIWIELALALDRLLGLRRPSWRPDGAPSSTATIFRDRNFVDRAGLHLHRRHHPARHHGAAAADAVSACSAIRRSLTGLVMAPRGVGTMISMLLVGRLVRLVDARLLVFAGLLLTTWSLWHDDRLHAADGRPADHHVRRHPGPRPRPRLRAAVDGRLRDARAEVPHRRRRACSA